MAGCRRKPRAGRPRRLLAARLTGLLVSGALAASGVAVAGAGVAVAGAHPRRPSATGAHARRSATTTARGGVNIAGLGTGSLPAQADRSIAMAHALHAKLVRIGVPWSVLEPNEPNRYEPRALAYLDRLTADAAADGIGVIMTVDSTPCWASSAPLPLLIGCLPTGSGKANAWPPRDPASYAAVVGFLAARYGARLAAIEVWNEPDQVNEAYLAGPEKAQRYAAILRAAYPAIKRANPSVQVLAGSLVGSNGVFLRALYAAGIKGYYDGLAVHFYTLTLGALRATRETQLANGDSKPLWLDEFGWSSCWPRQKIQQEQGCVTARVQAQNITNIFRSLARTPYVAAEALYELQGSTAEDFGVVNERSVRKPAFAALTHVLVNPFGRPSRVTLALRPYRGGVLASGTGPVGDYMELEAFQRGVLRYKSLFTLDRFNRYAIPLPRALGRHGLRVRVYQYWAGAALATQRGI